MVRKTLLVFSLVFLGLSPGAADKPLQLSSDSDGKTISLKVGQSFDLTLLENPSTGYGWEVAGGADGVIQQRGKAEHHSLNLGTVGGGGTIRFHFTAAKAGTAQLKLIYRRSSDKGTPPSKTFQITVKVSSP